MSDPAPRDLARMLFDAGVRAADPGLAVNAALDASPLPSLKGGRHFVIAIGKAACAMAEAALDRLDSADVTVLAVTNYENARDIRGGTVLAAGHPTPDENGLEAGRLVCETLQSAGQGDHVLFLISGGGSALLPAPVSGVSLEDKVRVNDLLLANGFDITETNLVRQQLSRLKGGGMADMAAPATHRTLLVSDVIGDDPRVIASGPTVGPIGTVQDAADLLRSRGIWSELPASVIAALSRPAPQKAGQSGAANYEVICSNRRSLEAMQAAGQAWDAQIVSSRLVGDVGDAARQVAEVIRSQPDDQKLVCLWGGETTVQLRGAGRGGRNQELALRLALACADRPGNWAILAGGSDGRDGPTDAAGGIVDRGTIRRIRNAGADPDTLLADNDSNRALAAAGDLLQTGATGTNVADLLIFVQS